MVDLSSFPPTVAVPIASRYLPSRAAGRSVSKSWTMSALVDFPLQ
jgi:hypothetical protein